jgi:hypothetical protein
LSRGSSSTTSSTPRVRLLRHIARLVALHVVDYFASRMLVVDYFASAARPGASARRAARHAARHRLLRLRCASGCLDTSRGSSSITSPPPRVRVPPHVARLVVYFDYVACPVASARHVARRRLLRLRRASGCLGSSRDSSSTTSTTPRVRLLRHVARLVAPLVVDYFAYAAHPGASARRAARLAARGRLLRLHRASGCLSTSRGS